MSPPGLTALAEAAGIAAHWTDAFGKTRHVAGESLQKILASLGLAADIESDCTNSLAHLTPASPSVWPPLLTVWVGDRVILPAAVPDQTPYRILLESGATLEGTLSAAGEAVGSMAVQAVNEAGYHRLEAGSLRTVIAVAPRRCFGVADALACNGRPAGELPWGLAAQLYSLRSAHDGGLASYSALEPLAHAAAAQGAAALAISPVHAMFSAEPERFSPYGPSSRVFFNALHVDPSRVLGDAVLQKVMDGMPGCRAVLAALEKQPLVNWAEAARWRLDLLRQLFQRFTEGDSARAGEFTRFCHDGGQALQDHARFEAIDAWHRQQYPEAPHGDWRQWPLQFQDPRSAEVQVFAKAHSQEVAFHAFLQWQASAGRAAVQQAARDAGMAIGVVADLAVGADPGGSQAWGLQAAMLRGLTVGAPPDLLATQGQNWGLGAFSPHALRMQGFAPWIAMLRANMAHSGGIRIDHVLGLKRLWLVPEGLSAADGAYLHYPLEDLLRLTALESHRHQAIVIGEDLGTVPEGFSEQLADIGLLGIKALWFQRDGRDFLPPPAWPSGVMATTSTHDLATLAGWWSGRDIAWRERLDLLAADSSAGQALLERQLEKQALWSALEQAGLTDRKDTVNEAPLDETMAFIGSTPAALVLVPLEDAFGIVEQPNLPGTVAVHPNWQQRLPADAATLLQYPAVKDRLANLQSARAHAARRGKNLS